MHEIRYRMFVILYEEIGFFHLPRLTWNLTPLHLSEQLSTANNIFNRAFLNYFSFSEGIKKVPYFYIVSFIPRPQ